MCERVQYVDDRLCCVFGCEQTRAKLGARTTPCFDDCSKKLGALDLMNECYLDRAAGACVWLSAIGPAME
jgi:hypothetical protein